MPVVTVRNMTALRLLLLSVCAAAGWMALSFTVSTAPAATAETTTAGWGIGRGDDDQRTRLRDLRSTLTTATEPIVVATNELLNETTTVVQSAVDNTVEGAVSVVDDTVALLDTTVTTTRDTVEHVITNLDDHVLEPVTDALIERPDDEPGDLSDALGDLLTGDLLTTGAASTVAQPADRGDGIDITAAQIEQLTAALWPLSDSTPPWSPRELILISAGVITAGSQAHSGAGPGACDLPVVERWLSVGGGSVNGTVHDRVPQSPTYDTDCTPD